MLALTVCAAVLAVAAENINLDMDSMGGMGGMMGGGGMGGMVSG